MIREIELAAATAVVKGAALESPKRSVEERSKKFGCFVVQHIEKVAGI